MSVTGQSFPTQAGEDAEQGELQKNTHAFSHSPMRAVLKVVISNQHALHTDRAFLMSSHKAVD